MVAADPPGLSSQQQAASCKLTILGGGKGRLQHASMSCTGDTKPVVSINATHMGSFQSKFTGVILGASCISQMTDTSCLVTICSGRLVLRDSSVSMVQGIPVKNLVCVAQSSKLEIYNGRFAENEIRPLMIGGQAIVVMHASNVSNNAVRRSASGGGIWVEGNASVTITDGSRVEGNLVGRDGGGLAALGNASVTITGKSKVQGNTAGGAGGGLVVFGYARLAVAGGSSISNNKAARGGGGLDAEDSSTLTITGGSIVQGNTAAEGGGGLVVFGSAHVDVTGGSNISNNTAAMLGGGGLAAWENAIVSTKCHPV
jgi:hypothetical protein